MRSRPSKAFLVVPLVLYIGLMGCVFVCESKWTARQTWAIALTGGILIWYTWETMQLRYAAHAQIETQIRPYVVLKTAAGSLSALNVGNGVALHVRVDPVVVSEENKIEIRFPNAIPVLRPGESAPVEARGYKDGKDTGNFFTAHIDPRYAALDLSVTVRCDNVELKPYSITQKVSPGSIVVTARR